MPREVRLPGIAAVLAAGTLAAGVLVLRPMAMPSGAMEGTLHQGERYVMDVSRFWWNQPERGELVVLRSPVNAKQKFVKRIVGLPGDRIRIAARKLYVNGAAVAEPYVMRLGEAADEYRDNFPGTPNVGVFAGAETMLAQYVRGGEVVVPEGNYFVLGDNRDVSLDSRYWGFVAREALLGRPLFVYASAAGRPHLRWVD